MSKFIFAVVEQIYSCTCSSTGWYGHVSDLNAESVVHVPMGVNSICKKFLTAHETMLA